MVMVSVSPPIGSGSNYSNGGRMACVNYSNDKQECELERTTIVKKESEGLVGARWRSYVFESRWPAIRRGTRVL